MKKMKNYLPSPVPVSLLAGLLCCLPSTNQQAQLIIGSTAAAGFSGQAKAVTGVAGSLQMLVADTGALATTGGAIGAAAMETSVGGGLAVGASHTAVVGGGSATASEASVANVHFASSSLLGVNTVVADFVMSRAAAAAVTTADAAVAGAAQFSGLVVNGVAVAVTGAANQIVSLNGGGLLIINEQIEGVGTMTVNALHIVDTLAGVNAIIGASTAGVIVGSASTPPPCDFVTGGGWIVSTPSGAKANFGVAGGIKDGAFWGHLNYIDHETGMHLKDTAVRSYTCDSSDPTCLNHCRIICYDVTNNGVPGYTARVRVCDNGEPGWNDTFEIKLYSTPPPPPCGQGSDTPIYIASGDLGGGQPGGGNIQLHKCR
jgi:hypothetical protein